MTGPPKNDGRPTGQGGRPSKNRTAQSYREVRTLRLRLAIPVQPSELAEAIHAGYVVGARHPGWRRCPTCLRRGWAA
jgi:hypothetical protein